MTLAKKYKLSGEERGFTIIELLIVIVVIAILAALVIISYAGVQSRARDAERVSDIRAVQQGAELYNTNNGAYPARANANANLSAPAQGVDAAALKPPRGASGATLTATVVTTVGAETYAYVGYDCTGVGAAATCAGFRVEGDLENSTTNEIKRGGVTTGTAET